jgi:hypothetical protein
MTDTRKGARKSARQVSTPLTRLRRSTDQLDRVARVLERKFRAWRDSKDPQVALGAEAAADLRRVAARVSAVTVALEAAGFTPPEPVQYRPSVEGDHVRVAPKYKASYAEKCAEQLRACPELLDDLAVVRVYKTSRVVLVAHSPYPTFEARQSHLVPIRRSDKKD